MPAAARRGPAGFPGRPSGKRRGAHPRHVLRQGARRPPGRPAGAAPRPQTAAVWAWRVWDEAGGVRRGLGAAEGGGGSAGSENFYGMEREPKKLNRLKQPTPPTARLGRPRHTTPCPLSLSLSLSPSHTHTRPARPAPKKEFRNKKRMPLLSHLNQAHLSIPSIPSSSHLISPSPSLTHTTPPPHSSPAPPAAGRPHPVRKRERKSE